MLSIGKTYALNVLRKMSTGVMLDGENFGEIHLAHKHLPERVIEGEPIDVFLYEKSDGIVIATTEKPYCQLGEFAYLKVVDTSDSGAFVDIGIDKDVLVPFGEQHRPMEVGRFYIVHLYLDKRDSRLTASSKIDKFLDDEKPHGFQQGQAVNLLIGNSTELGFKAIIDNSHWGVLYKNEVFQRLSFGQRIDGFIKAVRPDNRLDLSLQGGKETRDKYSQTIITYLKKQGGKSDLNDKSAPEYISAELGMSKKAFKKAIGGLYKQRVIAIEADGIRLL